MGNFLARAILQFCDCMGKEGWGILLSFNEKRLSLTKFHKH